LRLKEIAEDEMRALSKESKTFKVGDDLLINGKKALVVGAHEEASEFVAMLKKLKKSGRKLEFDELMQAANPSELKALIYARQTTAELRAGITGLKPKFFQAHHIIPRELVKDFEDFFKKIGFNIEDGA
jgi:hypothetical protein